MTLLLKTLNNSLAGKLIVTVGMLIVVGGGLSWYVLLDAEKEHLIANAVANTTAYSDLVKKSTRYSMLTFHRESIQQTIEGLGSAADINRMRIFNSSGKVVYSSHRDEINTIVDQGDFACKGCHQDPKRPRETLTGGRPWVISEGADRNRVLTFVDPIYNEPSCSANACHFHPQGQRVLGILETDFSLAAVDKTIREQTILITLYAALFMVASALVLSLVLKRFVLNPVSALSGAMKKVAAGDLGHRVTLAAHDEMGLLASTFNRMAEELGTAREKIERWTQTLEEEVTKKTAELRRSQNKLIQAEKLASLGRLTADVAHQIRNPLSAVGGFARRLHRIVTGSKEKEYAAIVIDEVDRLEKILRDVLTFSRDARFNLERHHMPDVVRTTLSLYKELCNDQSVRLEVTMPEDLLPVLVDKEQVIQALGNLITNALEAMPRGGTLTVSAGMEKLYDVSFVVVRVADTGQGIPAEQQQLIFEPFFSNKVRTHGTGLGLSITRKIIEEHGGFIRVESGPGKGSAFLLYFPYQGAEQASAMPCWEFMKCGRDKDASEKCPAYAHFGRICWVVAGTFCEGKVQGTFAQKCEDCRKCAFYQMLNKENQQT